jgi:hypothetical protein
MQAAGSFNLVKPQVNQQHLVAHQPNEIKRIYYRERVLLALGQV